MIFLIRPAWTGAWWSAFVDACFCGLVFPPAHYRIVVYGLFEFARLLCVWTSENDLKAVACGRGSFCGRETIYAVLNSHGYGWTGPKMSVKPFFHQRFFRTSWLFPTSTSLLTWAKSMPTKESLRAGKSLLEKQLNFLYIQTSSLCAQSDWYLFAVWCIRVVMIKYNV